jgi:two-component system chemotaxis response regulator CheB
MPLPFAKQRRETSLPTQGYRDRDHAPRCEPARPVLVIMIMASVDLSERVIVIGVFADGIAAISRIAAALPEDFKTPILVVQHVGHGSGGYLPTIVSHAGRLPVVHGQDGQHIEAGRIYVAPPDHHMLVQERRIRLGRGPSENYHRPSIDALFRSASLACGSAAIGVLLAGCLYDGAAGLLAIRDRGGVAIVEESVDTQPSALDRVNIDDPRELDEIGPRLVKLAATRPGPSPKPTVAAELEDQIARDVDIAEALPRLVATAHGTPHTCPLCSERIFELADRRLVRFRCAKGHAFTAPAVAARIRDGELLAAGL